MAKRKTVELPVSDKAEITETTIYPTVEAAFQECIAKNDWYEKYSPATRITIKFAFYTAVSEALRTVAFRMNAEQSDAVFNDFDKELRTYDRELQMQAEDYEAALQ